MDKKLHTLTPTPPKILEHKASQKKHADSAVRERKEETHEKHHESAKKRKQETTEVIALREHGIKKPTSTRHLNPDMPLSATPMDAKKQHEMAQKRGIIDTETQKEQVKVVNNKRTSARKVAGAHAAAEEHAAEETSEQQHQPRQ